MTILFINSIGKNKWGGGEKWIINTAAGLQNIGHHVIIGARKNSILIKNAQQNNLQTIKIKHANDFSLLSSLKLVQFINKNNIQIIIASLNRDVRICGFASLISKHKPKVIGRQGVQLISDKWKYKFTFTKMSHGILTNSFSLKKIYDQYDWWDNKFVKVIYNGISPTEKIDKTYNYNQVTNLSENTKVVISAGRLDNQKGFKYLVMAAQYAKSKNEDIKFFIAGTGREKKYLTKLIEDKGLENYVFLLGFIHNIQSLFKRADVFILPSLYEGMPNVLLEAMLEKIPVISTPVNGAAELIEDNKTGFFVPVKDPKAIYNKIKFVINNQEETQLITEEAHKSVLKNFNLNISIENIDKYLIDVLKENRELYFLDTKWLRKIRTDFNTFRYKNLKPVYYLKNYIKLKLLPTFKSKGYKQYVNKLEAFDKKYINNRVNYYNKLSNKTLLSNEVKTLKEFVFTGEEKTYFFDTWKYVRLFKPEYKFAYKFGDVTQIPTVPSILKSRPISDYNENSVILNLNYIRHFIFVNEKRSFLHKKNQLVWRGNIWTYQPQRVEFFKKHFENPMCDIGHVNKPDFESRWQTNKLSIDGQLQYKFILSIEGNDVATNLKWIMSSNSLAVMPTPKYETWFMEGTLIPDYHYIHIKDDYSDLNEKLEYYIQHPEKADEIRLNANKYVTQFKNKKREDLISLLVLKKYFEITK